MKLITFTSVEPASFRDNEDSKSTPDNNTAVQQKHSSPQLNNKNKSDRFEDHGIGQIHKPQNGKTDKGIKKTILFITLDDLFVICKIKLNWR